MAQTRFRVDVFIFYFLFARLVCVAPRVSLVPSVSWRGESRRVQTVAVARKADGCEGEAPNSQ